MPHEKIYHREYPADEVCTRKVLRLRTRWSRFRFETTVNEEPCCSAQPLFRVVHRSRKAAMQCHRLVEHVLDFCDYDTVMEVLDFTDYEKYDFSLPLRRHA